MGRRRGGRTLTPAALREVMRDEIGKAMSGAPRTTANPSGQAARSTSPASTPDTFGQLAAMMRAAVGYQARPMARDPRDSGPFGPMHPARPDPISPSRADTGRPEPWISEYPVAWNIPGAGERLMPWRVLDAAARNIDVIRRCIEIRKSRVRTAPWSWDISPQAIEDAYRADGNKGHDDIAAELRDRYRADINRMTEFWRNPWRAQGLDFGNWIGGVMEGRLKYDAVVVYPRTNLGGDTLLGLEIIDPTTIKPLLDYRGSRPEPPYPAFQQILYGFPRGEWQASTTEIDNDDGTKSIVIDGAFRADELVYLRENYQLNSPYGYGPTEQALVASRLWMRRQGWLLAEYTDGVAPSMFLELPAEAQAIVGMTPEQRVEWESSLNDELAGQTGERHRAKVGFPGMIPHLMPSVDERYKPDYDLFLLKLQCSFFGVPVGDLGFTDSRGLGAKGVHESQAENRADISTGPDLLFAAGLVNDIGRRYQGAPPELVFAFTDNDGGQDETQAATIRAGEVSTGQKTLNDSRRENSLPVYQFPEADMPFVMGAGGPVFLAGSLAASRRAQGLDENGKPLPADQQPARPGGNPQDDTQGGDGGGPGKGPAATKAASADLPLSRQVRAQLAPDYPDEATAWVADANWAGPLDVPPNRIDLDNVKSWDAYRDKAKVDRFRKLMHRAGALKPIVAVTTPGDDRVKVVDGHHRALAAVREAMPVRAYVGAVDARTGPWDQMHTKQHPGGHHGEVDDAAPVSAPPAAGKAAGVHEPSADARAEIGAYHRWAAKATTGGRPFSMQHATPDDFPDGVPAGIEFADWVWLGYGGDDLVKAYEPWWPRDSRGKWIKRGSFAGLEDKIRELHGKKAKLIEASDRRIVAARDRAAGARMQLSHTTDPEARRALLAEVSTHEATIVDERAKRARHVAAQRDAAAAVLKKHEAATRKAGRTAKADLGHGDQIRAGGGLVRVNIKGESSDPSTWSVTGFEGLDKHDAGAAIALTRYARRPGEVNARLRTPDKRLSEPTFEELMGRAPADPATEAKAVARADRHVKAIDRVMARSALSADTTLYRGGSAADFGELKVGDEFTDAGFASTATSRAVAEHSFGSGGGRTLLTIHAPAGTHAVELRGLGEHEVLLDRGQRFQVIADRGRLQDGGHHYEVRIVPKDEAGPAARAPARSPKRDLAAERMRRPDEIRAKLARRVDDAAPVTAADDLARFDRWEADAKKRTHVATPAATTPREDAVKSWLETVARHEARLARAEKQEELVANSHGLYGTQKDAYIRRHTQSYRDDVKHAQETLKTWQDAPPHFQGEDIDVPPVTGRTLTGKANPAHPLAIYGDMVTVHDRTEITHHHMQDLEGVDLVWHEFLAGHFARKGGADEHAGIYVGAADITRLDSLARLANQGGPAVGVDETRTSYAQVGGILADGHTVAVGHIPGQWGLWSHDQHSTATHEMGHAVDWALQGGGQPRASLRTDWLGLHQEIRTASPDLRPYFRDSPTEAWAKLFEQYTAVEPHVGSARERRLQREMRLAAAYDIPTPLAARIMTYMEGIEAEVKRRGRAG